MNLISCLVDRAYKLCSTRLAFDKEIEFLKKYFSQNGFPVKIVNSKIQEKINSFEIAKVIPQTAAKLKLFSSLPYLDKESNAGTHKEIQELVFKFFPQIELNIVFKNQKTIQNVFNFKDRIPDLMRSNVVYKYTERKLYLGQIKMLFKVAANNIFA